MRTVLAVMLLGLTAACPAAEKLRKADVRAAFEKAVQFFSREVAVEGGYVWRYSADLSKREGEGKVGMRTVWVQPPATPTVGEAFLSAHELTGDEACLDAARAAGAVLLRGQMHTGGWIARIELDPQRRRRYAYRVDGPPAKKARRYSSLDDDQTQSALRLLMRLDRATGFEDEPLGEAVRYGLTHLLAAQFPNGGWPHVWDGPAPELPVKPAAYPPKGQATRIKAHWTLYTINDNLMRDVIRTLLLAAEVYGEGRYRKAALAGGDFLLLARMPEPQPAWAQQYDFDMQPCWARKFEPPAVTGGESQGVMLTLLELYERTGQRKYLDAVAPAIAYFKRSKLPDGRLARFYELRTNRPLYFTKDYKLTYDDSDLPDHYAFKVGSNIDRIERRYRRLKAAKWQPPKRVSGKPSRPSDGAVRSALRSLDDRGAWVTDGRLEYHGGNDPTRRVIEPRVFCRRIELLARWLATH